TGGILGIAIGWLIGRAITLGTNIYLSRQGLNAVRISSVPWWLALSALGFAIVVSLAAGIYPASRAARLNPVDALRYESSRTLACFGAGCSMLGLFSRFRRGGGGRGMPGHAG